MKPLVKVCGITRLEDAEIAIELGASALGFVFYAPSPRKVAPQHAARIVRSLPPFVVTVGVFVKESASEMNRIAELCKLDKIQLHGGEPFSLLANLARPGYRAFRPRDEADVAAMECAPDTTVLLDTYSPELYGGTGRPFNAEWARRIGKGRRIILAGGLNPDNVAHAVDLLSPYALDVSSSLESGPGIKNHALMRAFFDALDNPTPSNSLGDAHHAGANR